MKRDKFLIILSYALVYIVWSTTYFFIKVAVATIPAAYIIAWRFAAGCLILASLAALRGGFKPFPRFKEIAGSAFIGIMLLLLGNGLITLAEQTIPSWMGSIILACMPIYIAFYNFLLYRTKIAPIRLAGALIGIAGVFISLFDRTASGSSLVPGILLGVLSALAWGFGSSAAKALPKVKDVFASTAVQMLTAAIGSFIIGAASGGNPLTALTAAEPWSLFALCYLAVLGSLTLVAYNYLLVKEPTFRVSSYSLVNPVIAVVLGLATGEAAAPFLAVGLPPVLIGLGLMLYGEAILKRFKRG